MSKATNASAKLKEYAARIEELRTDILFGDDSIEDPMESFGRRDGQAQQFFLLALAQLDTAQRMMQIAAFNEQEGQVA
jgi:hypothetical protein